MSGVIAIVGRPNVGKSALFNRIAGRRIAIVHDQPGVTRDRVSAEVEWQGHPFTLVDTGGIGLVQGEKSADVIARATVDQVTLAVEAAQLILFVVNVQEGIVPLDEDVAARLHHINKPVLVVVNKADHERAAAGMDEFASLGFPSLHPVSAIHGRGMDDLMQAALSHLPAAEGASGEGESEEPPLKLAFVGRPNVGKSSIVNAFTRSERVIVSPIPGTTRDSVDVPFEVDTDGVRQKYLLIDTAGIRKKRRIDDSIEFFSVKRSEDSIARCDICILVMDAEQGVSEQDKKIADHIVRHHRACILVVNKWDLYSDQVKAVRIEEMERRREGRHREKGDEGPMTTLKEFGEWVQSKLFFLDYAPVIFTSAKSGFHLDRLLEAIRYVRAQSNQTVPTALLNRTLQDAMTKRAPVSKQGGRMKFYYATQVGTSPPRFVLFLNRKDLLADDYAKYLSRELRRAFGFEGCPILIHGRERPKSIESKRKPVKRRQKPQDKTRLKAGPRQKPASRKRR